METIGIVGAGIMGRGIAQVCATKGYKTHLYDVSSESLRMAESEIHLRLEREVEKGRITSDQLQEIKDRISALNDLTNVVSQADFVIEAVPENLELKRKIFVEIQEIDQSLPLATNTSSISITKLSEGLKEPQMVIGMHWFNPPPIMELIEIVVGKYTSKEVLDITKELAVALGKTPIVVNDFPGFATSRLGVALGLEAIRMVEQGVASPNDIDLAMKLGYRHPMGPLELTDYIGLDTRLQIAEYLNEENISPAFAIPNLLRDMVKEGKLGRKSGEGLFKWKDGKRAD